RQQHTLPRLTRGSADKTPMTSPPNNTGCSWSGLVVVLTAQVRDQLLALQVPQRVLQLHQLDEQIVLRVQTGRVNRALEVERQPLLDAVHARALREIEKQRDIQHDGSRQNAVATEEVDLQLHGVPQPADQIDVVPAFLVVPAGRIVVDPHDVAEIFVELRVELGLQDVVEDGLLALFLGLERLRIVQDFAVAVPQNVGRIPALDAEQARLEPGRDDGLDQRLPGFQ